MNQSSPPYPVTRTSRRKSDRKNTSQKNSSKCQLQTQRSKQDKEISVQLQPPRAAATDDRLKTKEQPLFSQRFFTLGRCQTTKERRTKKSVASEWQLGRSSSVSLAVVRATSSTGTDSAHVHRGSCPPHADAGATTINSSAMATRKIVCGPHYHYTSEYTNMEKPLARKKLEHYVEKFVTEYEKQLKELAEIISGVSEKQGKCTEVAVQIASAAAPLFGFPILGTVVNATVSHLGKWYQKNRAQKFKRLINAFRGNDRETRKLFVEAAVEIFYMFEYQLCRVECDGSWERALDEFAEDAVERSIGFLKASRDEINLEGVVKGVIMGHSKCKSVFPALKNASGRHVTFTDMITGDWETSEVYSEAGLLLQIENDKFRVHCKKKVSQDLASPADLFRYGYRLSSTIPALRCWENSQYFEDRTINLRDRPQEYLLMSSDRADVIKEVCKEVSSSRSELNDPGKKLINGIELKDDMFTFQLNSPVENFVERSGKLDEIAECFTKNKILVLSGFIGNGKSELARKYAKECKEDIVIFLHAQTRHSLEESFISLAESCFINLNLKENGQRRNIAVIVRDVYAALKNKKCLFIFDDAPGYKGIEALLPEDIEENDWTVLITSNKTDWEDPYNHTSFGELKLSEFTHNEAVTFVEKIIGTLTESDVENLVDKLPNPLALRHATANIQQRVEQCQKRNQLYTVNHYLEELENNPCDLKILGDEKISMALKLTLSCLEQDENGRKARRLLNIMYYLGVSGIPDTLFLKFLANDNRSILHDIISILENYSILRVEKRPGDKMGLLTMHGLVPDLLKCLMANDTEKKFTEEETLNDALEILKTAMQDDLVQCKTCVPHLISVWNYACNYKEIVETFITAKTSSASFFYHIVNFGNSDMIRKTLDQLDPSVRTLLIKEHHGIENGSLIFAALSNPSENVDIVKILLSYGADEKNVVNNYGSTLLHEAVARGHLGVVKYLIEERKIDPNTTKNKHGGTALHVAAELGQLHILKYLVEGKRRADPNVTNDNGDTPVHIAAVFGHLDIVKYLVEERRIDDNSTGCEPGGTPLDFAAAQGHDIVKLEERLTDLNVTNNIGDTPLYVAMRFGQHDVVKYLINVGYVDPNVVTTYGWTLLRMAAAQGFLDIVAYLIEERKCDPNETGEDRRTALFEAIGGGHIKLADYLLNHGASLICDYDHHTLLHEAVRSNNSPDAVDFVLKLLKERFADDYIARINAADSEGNTPLMWAIEMGSTNIAKTLLDNGADVNVVNKDNETALHWTAKTGDWETANILRAKGINEDLKGKDGRTAVEVAKAIASNVECEDEKSKFVEFVENMV